MSSKVGNIRTLIGCLVVWMGVCVCVQPRQRCQWILRRGGRHRLHDGRNAKPQPQQLFEDAAEHRGPRVVLQFYEVLEKGGLIIGMFSWGYIEGFTGSMRSSILALIIFFVVSIALLSSIPKALRI